jgi:hypothetical protein
MKEKEFIESLKKSSKKALVEYIKFETQQDDYKEVLQDLRDYEEL